jgi:hypothetical protein
MSHTIITHDYFVSGDKSICASNPTRFDDWEKGTRDEAKRIADGLGGAVVEEKPRGVFLTPYIDQDGGTEKRTITNEEHLRLAIVVNGQTVARVCAVEFPSVDTTADLVARYNACRYTLEMFDTVMTKLPGTEIEVPKIDGADIYWRFGRWTMWPTAS